VFRNNRSQFTLQSDWITHLPRTWYMTCCVGLWLVCVLRCEIFEYLCSLSAGLLASEWLVVQRVPLLPVCRAGFQLELVCLPGNSGVVADCTCLTGCRKNGPSASAARPRTYRFLCTNLDGVNAAVRTSDLNVVRKTKLIHPSVSVSVHRTSLMNCR
jgi:hypothetical protein